MFAYYSLAFTEKVVLLQGVQQEKTDTIHRLQAMGLSVEQIAQGAGMKVDEVKKLLQ